MAVPHSKSDDALLKNLVPLNTLSDEQLGELLSRVTVEKAKKGQYLFREGDTDHQNIYLLHGTIALLSGQKEMDLVSSGTQTARFALAHQLPRKHSAQARTAVTYVRIDSRMLSDMLARSHSASYEVSDIEQPTSGDWMSLLLMSPVFQQIPPANLQRVMMRMEEIGVSAGDVIIRQGDEGDYFYLISKGECSVTRTPEEGHAPVELAKLRVGKGFGEEALISDKPRGSTVTMLSDGILVRLNKQDFIELVKQPLSRTIGYERACEDIKGGALWLDVRTPEEYEAGHLPGAINLPFFSLRFQASSLAMDRPYVVYGAEVGQSATAAYLLTERGAEIFVLDMGWAELEGVAGLHDQAGDESPVNNVIDFNREGEDSAAQAKRQEDAHRVEIDQLRRDLDEARAAYDEELSQRKTEIKLLKQALAVAKERAEGGDEQAQQYEALKQELAESQSQTASLDSQLASLREELEQTRDLGKDFRQQSVDLQAQSKEQQERHETLAGRLKEEITELRLQLDSAGEAAQLAAEKERELEALKSAMAELEASSEAYRRESADDLARLTAERFELESTLHQLQERQSAEQADEQQKLASLQQSLQEAEAALKQSESEFQQRESALQSSLEQARNTADEAQEGSNREIESLRAARQSLQSELDAAKQEMEQVGEKSRGEKNLLQQQIDTLQKELEQQEQSRQSLQQAKVSLEERLHQGSGEAAELATRLEAAEERRQSLEKELDAIRQAGSDAESQYNNAMASLREDLEQSRNTIDELRHVRQQLEDDLEQARAGADSLQTQLNETLASARQQAGEEQARLDAVLAGLKEELDSTRAEANQEREKRVEMEALLEQEHQTASYLQRSLKTAEEAVEVSDRQFSEAEESRQALEKQLSELQRSLERVKETESDLQQSLELSGQEKAELEQTLEQRDQEKTALEETLQQGQREKADLEQSLEQLRKESAGMAQELEAARTAGEQEQLQTAEALADVERQRSELQAQLQQIQSEREQEQSRQQADQEALRQELEALRAAAETTRSEHEAEHRALSESQELIDSLKREIEGLREVQIEMESQLSDDADAEIQQLRGALEAEEQKRRKAEKLAQKADVMRRERDVQETAIEMLHEDLESVTKEKDELTAERDKLVKQMREIRAQYTDLVNENDQLHSEMSGLVGQANDSTLAEDLLSQMEELRSKAERIEQERDRARGDASRLRREVGELRSVIETYVEQIQDVQSFGSDEQMMALRTELDMVRRQAHEDLEQMRQQLQEAEARMAGAGDRDVDFVADQQAIRQEMVSLQQALSEKDHLLRLSQNQCRTLEDAVEDRDKEVDQLKRKLELLLRKTGGLDDPSMRLGSRNFSESQQQEALPDGLGNENDSRKSGIGRLFRKK